MTQNERLTQAELAYLRAKIPPCEPFTDVLKPIDRKAEYVSWLVWVGLPLAVVGAVLAGYFLGGLR